MELKSLSHTHPQLLVDALTTLGLLRCYGLEVGSPKVGTAGSGDLRDLSSKSQILMDLHSIILITLIFIRYHAILTRRRQYMTGVSLTKIGYSGDNI
ncbi:hypothetical protein ACOMHN_004113 [Nucella lapillus]